MALPSNLNLITVTGTFVDSTGTPHSGKVTFRPNERRRDPTSRVIVTPKEKFATLDTQGHFSITIPATDDPDLYPRGGAYQVEVALNGYNYSFTLAVPHDTAGGTLDLSHLSDVSVPVPITSPITAASIGGEMRINRDGAEPGFIVVLGEDGQLHLEPNVGGTGGGGGVNLPSDGIMDGGIPTTVFNSYTFVADGGNIATDPADFNDVFSVNGRTGDVVLTADDLDAAPVGHAHDDRYYTEAESDARFSPTTHLHDDRYPLIVHTHDDRYYTEAESDVRFIRTVNGVAPDGAGNVAVGNVVGTGITAIEAIGQAAYDALTTKSATTLYVITGA